ncbi:transposase [Embleya sp. NPDC127516]|uniref:transposase n=1 Tax=Embleya sp. NPDC127516 TaxID=3363990 RepID=UPI0037FCFA97
MGKWRLALDVLDEAADWDLMPSVVVADAGYGRNALFRAGPTERELDYVVAIRATPSCILRRPRPSRRRGRGRGAADGAISGTGGAHGRARDGDRPGGFVEVVRRRGSRGPMRSRFLRLRVRPAGIAVPIPRALSRRRHP